MTTKKQAHLIRVKSTISTIMQQQPQLAELRKTHFHLPITLNEFRKKTNNYPASTSKLN